MIIGTVAAAMRQRAVPDETVDQFREAAHKTKGVKPLLELCRQWVEVTDDEEDNGPRDH